MANPVLEGLSTREVDSLSLARSMEHGENGPPVQCAVCHVVLEDTASVNARATTQLPPSMEGSALARTQRSSSAAAPSLAG